MVFWEGERQGNKHQKPSYILFSFIAKKESRPRFERTAFLVNDYDITI
jgi:hypothetical protein